MTCFQRTDNLENDHDHDNFKSSICFRKSEEIIAIETVEP